MISAISNIIRTLGIVLFIYFFISLFSFVQALQLRETSIDEMFKNSVLVAVVKIKKAERIIHNKAGKTLNCGFNYQAKIIRSFKGTTAKINFRSHKNLVESRSYLIFFNHKYQDGNIRFLAMGKHDVISYKKCKRNLSGLYASDFFGEIFELNSPENTLSNMLNGKNWVVTRNTHIKIPKYIETKFVDISGPNIPKEYSDYYSHTLILRDEFYKYLETLSLIGDK